MFEVVEASRAVFPHLPRAGRVHQRLLRLALAPTVGPILADEKILTQQIAWCTPSPRPTTATGGSERSSSTGTARLGRHRVARLLYGARYDLNLWIGHPLEGATYLPR